MNDEVEVIGVVVIPLGWMNLRATLWWYEVETERMAVMEVVTRSSGAHFLIGGAYLFSLVLLASHHMSCISELSSTPQDGSTAKQMAVHA